MMKKLRKSLNRALAIDSQARFRMIVVMKILFTTMMASSIFVLLLWPLLEMDLFYFNSFGLMGQENLRTTFYEFISQKILELVPYVVAFFGLLLLMGLYITNLMLRPFKKISRCCLAFMEDPSQARYRPDFFSNLKVLVRFSGIFFKSIQDLLEKRRSVEEVKNIPEAFHKFHSPVFEWGFILQFSLLIMIMSAISMIGAQKIVIDMNMSLISFAQYTLKSDKNTLEFLSAQANIFDSFFWILWLAHAILNFSLILGLYSQVSAPAFAIFATMRSFLRGRHKSRVHLIGNYHIRPETKIINQFLDDLERKLQKNG